MSARRFDVFLCYNSADRAAVARIAEYLRQQRVEPWWDAWVLTPGDSWQDDIVEGLQSSRACAVVIGPAGLGDWARLEMAVAQDLAARDGTFRIFMVLLPGAPNVTDAGLAFLRTRTWVDLRAGLADAILMQDLVSAVTGVPRRSGVLVGGGDTCPFRGLEPFEEEHAEFFFGRENDVALALEKLRAGRFLAVLGPSGSGKSSLLRAGLVPALSHGGLPGSDGWTLRVFAPGPRPLVTLAAQMGHVFAEEPMQRTLDLLREDRRSLDLAASAAMSQRRPTDRVVLVVDQFEELFTLCRNDAERASFVANLLYAATVPGGRIVVVLGMRADFYHRCAPYPELRVVVADHQLLVGPLDADGLRRSLEEPARQAGLEFEAGLTETIATEVEAHPGSLPLLQHVLMEVWQRRQGRMLTLNAYVSSGGLGGALAQRANAIYENLSSTRQAIARRVLLRLVQPGDGAEDTRRRASLSELVRFRGEEGDVEAVVHALAEQRLVTTGRDDVSGVPVVDLTHEALIRAWPELRAWINENREALRHQRRLTEAATEWDRRGGSDDDLYAGARLAYWRERSGADLTAVERAFVSAGKRRESRQQAASRRRVRLAVSGVLVGLTIVATVALLGLRGVANQRDIARSRQLAAEATATLLTDPARGLQLAADAHDLKPTREAQRALRQAMVTPGSRVDVLRGHRNFVYSATFSPDGRRVLSAGDDGTLRVWDLGGATLPVVLRGHTGDVTSAAFSADGQQIVSAGGDGTVRVWDWAGRKQVNLRRYGYPVRAAALSPDGRRVVSARADATLEVWNLTGEDEPSLLRGHSRVVTSLAFRPDGRTVVSASEDATVRVWDLEGGGEPTVLRGHSGVVASAAFNGDGRRVVSAGDDATVRVWDLAGGAEPTVLRDHKGVVYDAAFSPDGRYVVSGGEDAAVRVWDWAGGGQSTVLPGHKRFARSAAFSPDGRRLVTAGGDATVRVWDLATGGIPTVLRGHAGSVRSATFDPHGVRVASGGFDSTVRVWDLGGAAEPIVLRGYGNSIYSVTFSADGRRVLSAGTGTGLRIWDVSVESQPAEYRSVGLATSASFSPDGARVLSAGFGGTVSVLEVSSRRELTVLRGHDQVVWSAAFSSDGGRVVSAGGDGTVRVWDLIRGGNPTVLRGHEGAVNSAAFSPDGRKVVSAGKDATVRVWDLVRGGDPSVLRGHDGAVNSAAFSPDGRKVVTAGSDATVKVWSWPDGGEPTVLRGHDGAVNSAAFSPDGRKVVTAGSDATVRVWTCDGCESHQRLVVLARSRISP